MRIALQAAAVAAAMVDEVDPCLVCTVAFGCIERVRDKSREVLARRRVVGSIDVDGTVDAAVAKVVGFRARAAVFDEVGRASYLRC